MAKRHKEKDLKTKERQVMLIFFSFSSKTDCCRIVHLDDDSGPHVL